MLIKRSREIIKEVIELVYFMRGAITYTEAYNMTPVEREVAYEFINKRLEAESKKPNPIY